MAYKTDTPEKLERARASRRAHYHANKEQYLERNRVAKRAKAEFIRQAKSVPCMDCGGEFHYCVMDFDHREGVDKVCDIGRMSSFTWKQIKAEIAKCDVVCSNCHRMRTFERSARK